MHKPLHSEVTGVCRYLDRLLPSGAARRLWSLPLPSKNFRSGRLVLFLVLFLVLVLVLVVFCIVLVNFTLEVKVIEVCADFAQVFS